jgi:hypothetical protein
VKLRTALPLAIVLLVALAPTLAWAAPPHPITARLEFKRGPGTEACPDEAGLRSEVARRSGHDPFTADAPARLVVLVTRKGPHILGSIQFYDDKGAPGWSKAASVRANDCGALFAVMGGDIEYEFSPAPPLPAHAPPVVAPPVVAPPPHEDPPAPTNPISLRFGLGSALGFGTAPRVALGLTADVGIYWPLTSLPFDGVSLTLGGRWDPPAAGQVSGRPDSDRVSTSRLLVTVAPCAHWWKLYGCAVGELGQLRGGGDGIALPTQEAGIYSAAGGRVGVEVPFAPHLGFRVSGEVLGTLTPIAIPVSENPGWTTPHASGGVAAGLFCFF